MREDEYSHKGIDRSTQIDKKTIESNSYRRKFDKATDNPIVNKQLYDIAKEILYDRSGSRYESMYWIDGNNGNIISKFDSMGKSDKLIGKEHEFKVEYSNATLNKIREYDNVIVLHNHPNSTAPSVGDLNSAYSHNYSIGFSVSHDGRVFKYISRQIIIPKLYELLVKDLTTEGFEFTEAQMKAFEEISRNFNIIVIEVK